MAGHVNDIREMGIVYPDLIVTERLLDTEVISLKVKRDLIT